MNEKELENITQKLSLLWQICSLSMGNKNFAIAGGAVCSVVLGQKPNDLDCFFNDLLSYEEACLNLRSNPEYTVVQERRNSVKFKHTTEELSIDVVKPSVDKDGHTYGYHRMTSDFDLVHTCMYYTPDKGIVQVHPEAMKLANDLVIEINKITLPYHTLSRIAKYKKRGFAVSKSVERTILDHCYNSSLDATSEIEYFFMAA